MKKIGNQIITCLTALGLIINTVPLAVGTGSVSATAASYRNLTEYTTGGEITDNISDNDYINNGRWSATVKSYLEETKDGYCRVEASKNYVVVEEYSKDYEFVSGQQIEYELPLFGGYFSGEQYRFLVFGQENTNEDDDVEVLRVVKYDQSWNRLDARSISAVNTYAPFEAGSLRMTEDGENLYIHTCHKMYKSSTDGKNHQANMTYVLNQSDMSVTQSLFKVSNIQNGYSSHSFNQFVQTDGTYLYRVDHGDAYPRSVVLTKVGVSNIVSKCTIKDVLPICGAVGANDTGVSVGGFEMAGSQLVVAGNSVVQDETTYSASGQRNVFVTSTDKELTDTNITWLTNYTQEDGITVGNPQLVKVSESELYVFWEEWESNKLYTVKVAQIDAAGTLQETVHTLYARLSDCAPVYTSGGEIVWYTTEKTSPVFYHLSVKNLSDYEYTGKIDMKDCVITINPEKMEYEDKKKYEPEVSVTYDSYTLRKGMDYDLSYSDNMSPGTASVAVTGKGVFEGTVIKEYEIYIKPSEDASGNETGGTGGDATGSGNTGSSTGENTSGSGNTGSSAGGNTSGSGNTGSSTGGDTAGSGNTGSSSGGITSGGETGGSAANDLPATGTVKVKKPGKVTGLKVHSTKKKQLTVRWSRKKDVSGYQIQYAQNKKFTKNKRTKTVGQGKTSKTLKGLKKGKTYYVRVRAYNKSSKKKLCGPWSKVKKVKVK